MKQSYDALREYLAKETTSRPIGTQREKNEKEQKSKKEGDAVWLRGQSYFLALQECLVGWKFVVTERNYLGVAPARAQQGDTICILDGGVVPFLVRKSKHAPRAFELIGECYIDGLMNGEGEKLGAADAFFVLR
ncbi:hypothetical protein F4803DRAFT_556924 [Xylaria telfairii]|nr:hypothetical protein F4803DRAFT_556924 [Xylaria telfairii]